MMYSVVLIAYISITCVPRVSTLLIHRLLPSIVTMMSQDLYISDHVLLRIRYIYVNNVDGYLFNINRTTVFQTI